MDSFLCYTCLNFSILGSEGKAIGLIIVAAYGVEKYYFVGSIGNMTGA
jgi:hypothetical protein